MCFAWVKKENNNSLMVLVVLVELVELVELVVVCGGSSSHFSACRLNFYWIEIEKERREKRLRWLVWFGLACRRG